MKWILAVSLFFVSPQLFANGFGLYASSHPGISLFLDQNRGMDGYQLATAGDPNQVMTFVVDYQRKFYPNLFRLQSSRLSLYSGVGFKEVAPREQDASEQYIRLPFGAKFEWTPLKLLVFAEAGLELGPLMGFNRRVTPAFGLQVLF